MDIFGIPVTVDPDLKGDTVLFRTDTEQRIAAGAAKLRRLVEAGDPEIIEDLRSLAESSPYVITWHEPEPIRCECCGTLVALLREGLAGDGPDRIYRPAIWEWEMGRKHTLRRCEAMRAGKAAR